MIKKELKTNLKGFIGWLLVLVLMFLFVYVLYPFIITEENMESMNEVLNAFPEEVLKALNMDMTSISTAYGWFKSEGLMFIMIIIGLYASILGGTIVLKEENDKTIEYLGFLPISRKKVLTNKIIVSLIYIVSVVLGFMVFNLISLSISGDLDYKELILLSISPLFVALPLFGLSLFVSMFLHKTNKIIAISLGFVFLFYLLNMLGEISDNVKFIKYLSLYTLADTRGIINNGVINVWCIIISLLLSSIFISSSYILYDKKELI